jgi:hypothetical protein
MPPWMKGALKNDMRTAIDDVLEPVFTASQRRVGLEGAMCEDTGGYIKPLQRNRCRRRWQWSSAQLWTASSFSGGGNQFHVGKFKKGFEFMVFDLVVVPSSIRTFCFQSHCVYVH